MMPLCTYDWLFGAGEGSWGEGVSKPLWFHGIYAVFLWHSVQGFCFFFRTMDLDKSIGMGTGSTGRDFLPIFLGDGDRERQVCRLRKERGFRVSSSSGGEGVPLGSSGAQVCNSESQLLVVDGDKSFVNCDDLWSIDARNSRRQNLDRTQKR